MSHGHFLVIEGIDGVGKTTVVEKTVKWFTDRLIPVLRTREPGGTPAAERIRELVLMGGCVDEPFCEKAELMLMMAARAQHLEKVILPALAEGKVVICDRYVDSTIAYQGIGRGLGIGFVKGLHEAMNFIYPDTVMVLDMDVQKARTRLIGRGRVNELDKLLDEFYEKSRSYYLSQVGGYAGRQGALLVNADCSPEEVMAQVEHYLTNRVLPAINSSRTQPTGDHFPVFG